MEMFVSFDPDVVAITTGDSVVEIVWVVIMMVVAVAVVVVKGMAVVVVGRIPPQPFWDRFVV